MLKDNIYHYKIVTRIFSLRCYCDAIFVFLDLGQGVAVQSECCFRLKSNANFRFISLPKSIFLKSFDPHGHCFLRLNKFLLILYGPYKIKFKYMKIAPTTRPGTIVSSNSTPFLKLISREPLSVILVMV